MQDLIKALVSFSLVVSHLASPFFLIKEFSSLRIFVGWEKEATQNVEIHAQNFLLLPASRLHPQIFRHLWGIKAVIIEIFRVMIFRRGVSVAWSVRVELSGDNFVRKSSSVEIHLFSFLIMCGEAFDVEDCRAFWVLLWHNQRLASHLRNNYKETVFISD